MYNINGVSIIGGYGSLPVWQLDDYCQTRFSAKTLERDKLLADGQLSLRRGELRGVRPYAYVTKRSFIQSYVLHIADAGHTPSHYR